MIYEKIVERRTIRKYIQKEVKPDILIKCVNAARLSPSANNLQPLKYVIVNKKKLLKEVLSSLPIWAGDLKYKPILEEMPCAYIVILLDKSISNDARYDAGIAAMSISMVAYDEGIGSCIFGYAEKRLKSVLDLPDQLDIILVVALGYPAEKPVVDTVKRDDTKFWLDEKSVFHVPKRSLDDIVRWNKYS